MNVQKWSSVENPSALQGLTLSYSVGEFGTILMRDRIRLFVNRPLAQNRAVSIELDGTKTSSEKRKKAERIQ